MPRRSKLDRAKVRKGTQRERTSFNFLTEARVALKIQALMMREYRGRERSESLANEHFLYQNDEFRALLPVARKLIEQGKADQLKVYRISDDQLQEAMTLINNIKRGDMSEHREGRGDEA